MPSPGKSLLGKKGGGGGLDEEPGGTHVAVVDLLVGGRRRRATGTGPKARGRAASVGGPARSQ